MKHKSHVFFAIHQREHSGDEVSAGIWIAGWIYHFLLPLNRNLLLE